MRPPENDRLTGIMEGWRFSELVNDCICDGLAMLRVRLNLSLKSDKE